MTFLSLNFPPQLIKKLKSKQQFIFVFILIILVGFCYYPALDNEFVQWDDQFYITDNPLIYHPTWDNFKLLFTKIISLNYHPITMISLWINSFLSGTENAFPYIATNIFLHTINTILVFLFVKKINPKQLLVAFSTALIFGIHPMHVESVAWISERKDVLYALFFLLASIQYLNFLEKKNNKYYGMALLFFVLACLSKAMAVALVPVLYLIDYYTVRDFKQIKIHLEKIPFLLIALLIGTIAINVQAGGDFYGILESSYDDKALSQSVNVNFFTKIKFACYGLYFYFSKFFFPIDLAAIHPYGSLSQNKWLNILPILGIGLLVFLGYCFFKNKKIAFGISYFLLTVFLVLQFIPVGTAVVAERYSYLPYIGLGFLLGLFFQKNWKTKFKPIIAIALLLISGWFTFLTRSQVDVWQNQISLFENAINVYPNYGATREYLATGYWLKGDLDQAIQQLDYAINKLHYHKSPTYELLATCYDDKNEPDSALVYYNQSLNLNPNNFVAHYHRGLLLLDIDPKAALEDFIFCKKSKSDYLQDIIAEPLARCYGILGDYKEALTYFNKAIQVDPNAPMTYYNRGVNHEKMKNFDLAILDYKKAITLDKDLDIAHQRIKLLDQYLGMSNE